MATAQDLYSVGPQPDPEVDELCRAMGDVHEQHSWDGEIAWMRQKYGDGPYPEPTHTPPIQSDALRVRRDPDGTLWYTPFDFVTNRDLGLPRRRIDPPYRPYHQEALTGSDAGVLPEGGGGILLVEIGGEGATDRLD